MKTTLKSLAFALTVATAATPLTSAQAQTFSTEHKELAAENFIQADANKDGALNRGEFRTLINLNAADSLGRANMIKRFNRYDMAFGRIDANADGFVTPEEMQAMAAQVRG